MDPPPPDTPSVTETSIQVDEEFNEKWSEDKDVDQDFNPPTDDETRPRCLPDPVHPTAGFYADPKKLYCIIFFFCAQVFVKVGLGVNFGLKSGYISRFIGLLYWATIFNVWIIKLIFFDIYKTLEFRYTWEDMKHCPYFYMFLLDYCFYLGIPLIGALFDFNMAVPLGVGIMMCIYNTIAFIIIIKNEVVDYVDYANNHLFVPLLSFEYKGPEKQLSILAWKSHKLVLQNTSDKNYSGQLAIDRVVYKNLKRSKVKSHVKINLNLIGNLPPGQIIVFHPEPYRLSGAFPVKGFRSFGEGRNTVVEITVYSNFERKGPFVVRRRVFYERKRGLNLAHLIGNNIALQSIRE